MSGVTGAGSDRPDETGETSGSETETGNRIEMEDTARIIVRAAALNYDPITAAARIAGTVQRLDGSERQHGEVWGVSAEIIEAPVEYARVGGTIDDQVLAEDHEDGVILTVEPCIRVSDPHEPAVGRSSRVSNSLLISGSDISII